MMGLHHHDFRNGPCLCGQREPFPQPLPTLREDYGSELRTCLDVIDGIVDDTHPEGDGCPLCHELDVLRDVVGRAFPEAR